LPRLGSIEHARGHCGVRDEHRYKAPHSFWSAGTIAATLWEVNATALARPPIGRLSRDATKVSMIRQPSDEQIMPRNDKLEPELPRGQ